VGFFPFAETVKMENGSTAHHVLAVAERGQHVCRYLSFQAVSASLFSLTLCLLLFVIFSCFLPSSVSLVHNVCTSFQASAQVNRNLVLRLVLTETIAVEVSIG